MRTKLVDDMCSVFERMRELVEEDERSWSEAMRLAEEELGISLDRRQADGVMRWAWAESVR